MNIPAVGEPKKVEAWAFAMTKNDVGSHRAERNLHETRIGQTFEKGLPDFTTRGASSSDQSSGDGDIAGIRSLEYSA